jgi:hypothetical protein
MLTEFFFTASSLQIPFFFMVNSLLTLLSLMDTIPDCLLLQLVLYGFAGLVDRIYRLARRSSTELRSNFFTGGYTFVSMLASMSFRNLVCIALFDPLFRCLSFSTLLGPPLRFLSL